MVVYKKDDYISREIARRIIDSPRSKEQMLMVLSTVPPLGRQVGEWIVDGHHIRCSQCDMTMCDKDREGDAIPISFCPNCGAVMKGENDESD